MAPAFKTGAESLTWYGMLELASVAGVGYSHGISSLAGGIGLYMAAIGYCGSAKLPTPIWSDESYDGDPTHTKATDEMSGHEAD